MKLHKIFMNIRDTWHFYELKLCISSIYMDIHTFVWSLMLVNVYNVLDTCLGAGEDTAKSSSIRIQSNLMYLYMKVGHISRFIWACLTSG